MKKPGRIRAGRGQKGELISCEACNGIYQNQLCNSRSTDISELNYFSMVGSPAVPWQTGPLEYHWDRYSKNGSIHGRKKMESAVSLSLKPRRQAGEGS